MSEQKQMKERKKNVQKKNRTDEYNTILQGLNQTESSEIFRTIIRTHEKIQEKHKRLEQVQYLKYGC